MPRRCERCNRLFEFAQDGAVCSVGRDGVDPCFRAGIRWLDDGDGEGGSA